MGCPCPRVPRTMVYRLLEPVGWISRYIPLVRVKLNLRRNLPEKSNMLHLHPMGSRVTPLLGPHPGTTLIYHLHPHPTPRSVLLNTNLVVYSVPCGIGFGRNPYDRNMLRSVVPVRYDCTKIPNRLPCLEVAQRVVYLVVIKRVKQVVYPHDRGG